MRAPHISSIRNDARDILIARQHVAGFAADGAEIILSRAKVAAKGAELAKRRMRHIIGGIEFQSAFCAFFHAIDEIDVNRAQHGHHQPGGRQVCMGACEIRRPPHGQFKHLHTRRQILAGEIETQIGAEHIEAVCLDIRNLRGRLHGPPRHRRIQIGSQRLDNGDG